MKGHKAAVECLRSYISSCEGRAVKGYGCPGGIILRWQPLSAALCDCLVLLNDDTECWFALSSLSANTSKPLPKRETALELSRIERRIGLEAIRTRLVEDFHKPWPGMEFGKVHLGQAINNALRELGA